VSTEAVQKYLTAIADMGGAPYVWQGKGRSLWHPVKGLVPHNFDVPLVFDCSGLVTWGLYEAGWKDWRASHSAETLRTELQRIDEPEAGDLVLYGSPGHATHVETVMPDGSLYGAIGGGPQTTKPDPERARVRFRTKSRPDSLGYYRNPLRAP
jgi:murein DD-endopeptidase